MTIQFVRVELKYAGGMAILDLSRDDIAALVALADELRGLVTETVRPAEPWQDSMHGLTATEIIKLQQDLDDLRKVPDYMQRRV